MKTKLFKKEIKGYRVAGIDMGEILDIYVYKNSELFKTFYVYKKEMKTEDSLMSKIDYEIQVLEAKEEINSWGLEKQEKKNQSCIKINYDYIEQVSRESGIGTDMLFSEFNECVDCFLEQGWFKHEIDTMIENFLDEFVVEMLPELRKRVLKERGAV